MQDLSWNISIDRLRRCLRYCVVTASGDKPNPATVVWREFDAETGWCDAQDDVTGSGGDVLSNSNNSACSLQSSYASECTSL